MDHTYQRPLQLPACCSVLSAEEMTYTEGGALSINITPEQVMAFGINATVNLLGMMGRYAFQAAVSGMQNALNDGLGVGDAIGHYWGKLNTWSKVATIGMAGLGGYYAYCQARSIYLSIKNLVDAFKNTYNEIPVSYTHLGFDGITMSRYCVPVMTTIVQPSEQIALQSIELLVRQIEHGSSAQTVTLQPELQQGESVRAI